MLNYKLVGFSFSVKYIKIKPSTDIVLIHSDLHPSQKHIRGKMWPSVDSLSSHMRRLKTKAANFHLNKSCSMLSYSIHSFRPNKLFHCLKKGALKFFLTIKSMSRPAKGQRKQINAETRKLRRVFYFIYN